MIKGSLPTSSSASTTSTTTDTPSNSQSAKSTKTPFQLLAESVAVMQVTVNDKISTVQQSVNEGINVVKKLITDPMAGVEPRVTKLEAQVPVIEGLKRQIEGRKSGLITRVTEVEDSLHKLSSQGHRVYSQQGEQDLDIDANAPEVIQCLQQVEQQVLEQETTMDLVVAWAGALQRSHAAVKKQVQFNTSKHHTNDLLVGGIYEHKKQDCRKAALKFFRECMKLTVAENEVIRAYRTGQPHEYIKDGIHITCPRQMVVKCSARLRDAAMQNKKVLGGQKDPKDNFSFFVTQYLPEPFKAAREKYKEDVVSIYKKNEKQLPKYRKTACVVGTELSVNNEICPDPLYPPDIHQVVHALRVQQDKLSSFEFQESSPVCVEDSVFRVYAIRVTQLLSVELAYVKARQQVPNADHIMVAYRIPDIEGSCADGEHYGDLQIMKLLKQKLVTDVAVFVARSKGEANLGARHFQAMWWKMYYKGWNKSQAIPLISTGRHQHPLGVMQRRMMNYMIYHRWPWTLCPHHLFRGLIHH